MAAIIYDDKYEALIIMSKPADHTSPGIPAVFISQKSGLVLKKLMTPGVSLVMITPVRQPAPLTLACAGCTGITQLGPTAGSGDLPGLPADSQRS